MQDARLPAASDTGLRFARSRDNRVLSGTAAGIGNRLGIDADYVRAAFVALTFAGGVGVAAYLAAWLLARGPSGPEAESHTAAPQHKASLVLMLVGSMLILRGIDLWFGDRFVWPVTLFAFGAAAVGVRRPGDEGSWMSRLTAEGSAPAGTRLVVGAVFLTGGLLLLLSAMDGIGAFGPIVLAAAVTAAGLLIIFGPWMFRLGSALAEERRSRIRSEERAELAAHIHDSVLQTLSLIQRTDDPQRMTTLARAQERELRTWLYRPGAITGSVEEAIRNTAGRLEVEYNTVVDVVAVGDDVPIDDSNRPLVNAVSEAITNAVKHSGAPRVSVYVESADGRVDAFVTDQGSGFDPASVPPDRRGLTESIVRRMERAGGGAAIESKHGEGTEIHVWVGGP
jgi:phage shock protein PspC (stress-responsive transcriptional regulator)/signal transduction histidine kinase